jgi:hypothetical protein
MGHCNSSKTRNDGDIRALITRRDTGQAKRSAVADIRPHVDRIDSSTGIQYFIFLFIIGNSLSFIAFVGPVLTCSNALL